MGCGKTLERRNRAKIYSEILGVRAVGVNLSWTKTIKNIKKTVEE